MIVTHYTIPDYSNGNFTETKPLKDRISVDDLGFNDLVFRDHYFEGYESAFNFYHKLVKSSNEIERAYAASSPIIFTYPISFKLKKKTKFDNNISEKDMLAKHLLFDNSLLVYNELMKLKPISYIYIEGLIKCYDEARKNGYYEPRKEDVLKKIGENLWDIVKIADERANGNVSISPNFNKEKGKDPFLHNKAERISLKSRYCYKFLINRIGSINLLEYAYEGINVEEYGYGEHKDLLKEMFDLLKEEDLPNEEDLPKAKDLKEDNDPKVFSCFKVLSFITRKAILIKDYELLELIVSYLNNYYPNIIYPLINKGDFTVYFDLESKKYMLLDEQTAEEEWQKWNEKMNNQETFEEQFYEPLSKHLREVGYPESNLPD